METTKQETQNSIKLMKGMTGKYGWEIKLYFDEEEPLEQLDKLNKQLNLKYGQ